MIIARTTQEMQLAIQRLKPGLIAYDLESSGLNPRKDKLLIIALSDNSTDIAIDCTALDPYAVYKAIAPLLQSSLVLGHNLTFDWKWAHHYHCDFTHMHDTMICEQVLTAGILIPQGFSLKAVAARYTGATLDKDVRSEFIDNPDIVLEHRHFEYALEDVRHLFMIYEQQMRRIRKNQLEKVYDLEMNLIPCTSTMEYEGIHLNVQKLTDLIPTFQRLVAFAERSLQDLFIANGAVSHILFDKNGYKGIKLQGPQVVAALHAVGVDVPSMNVKEVLRWDMEHKPDVPYDYRAYLNLDDDEFADAIDHYEGLSNPYLRALSFYTAARKLLNSYVLGTLENVDPATGKFHGWFKQVGARSTGRYSSNAQQLPKDEKLARLGLENTSIRACLEAAPDNNLLIADFQGIELVILADRSGDEVLGNIIVASGNKTDDMHLYVTRNTLTEVHKDAERATLVNYESGKIKTLKPLRQGAKRVSYAIAYGVTGVSLSEQLSIDLAALGVKVSRPQADAIITYWKQKAFPKAGKWLDGMSRHALMHGYTASVLGRRRWYDLEYAALHKWRKFAIMREASNQGIQSTSADMTKLAMLYTYQELDKKKANIVLSVHDELVLESSREYTETAAEILQNSMERAAQELLPMMGNSVKVSVNVSNCYNK